MDDYKKVADDLADALKRLGSLPHTMGLEWQEYFFTVFNPAEVAEANSGLDRLFNCFDCEPVIQVENVQ